MDSIYTGRPSTCSTSYMFWEIIKDLCEWRDDVFFYLGVPKEHLTAEPEWEFLHRMTDRVTLVPLPYRFLDRVADMFRFDEELTNVIAPFESPYWDIDAILTSRIPKILDYRVYFGRASMVSGEMPGLKSVIGLDEMPLFSFREMGKRIGANLLDWRMLESYLASDGVVINNLWTKSNAVSLAKSYITPSRVIEMKNKIHEAIPVKLHRLNLREPRPRKEGVFTVAFCGRTTFTRNFGSVVDLFRKHYAYGKGKEHVRYVISTQSLSTGSADMGDMSFLEVQNNDREGFHKFLKEEADVVVNISRVEDFSLSTYEPMLQGVPVIVAGEEWADFLGPSYPFRVDDLTQAYAVVKSFIFNYKMQYERFMFWEEQEWKPLVESPRNQKTSEVVRTLLAVREKEVLDYVVDHNLGKTYAEVADKLEATDKKRVDLYEYLAEADMIREKSRDEMYRVPLAKRPLIYLFKLIMNSRGWKDELRPGWVSRPQESA